MGNCCVNHEELPVVENTTGYLAAKKAPPQGSIKASTSSAPAAVDDAPAPVPEEPPKPALEDLSAPRNWSMGDKIIAFEHSLPFNRIEVSNFMTLVEQAAEAQKAKTGVENAVTLETLSEFLDSEAWAPLKDPGSVLAKMLLHERFHEADGTPADHVDVDILKCFGLFHN